MFRLTSNFAQNCLLFPILSPTLTYSCRTGSAEDLMEKDRLLEDLSQLYAEKNVSVQKAAMASANDRSAAVELERPQHLTLPQG